MISKYFYASQHFHSRVSPPYYHVLFKFHPLSLTLKKFYLEINILKVLEKHKYEFHTLNFIYILVNTHFFPESFQQVG
jgi:hypothetical protein